MYMILRLINSKSTILIVSTFSLLIAGCVTSHSPWVLNDLKVDNDYNDNLIAYKESTDPKYSKLNAYASYEKKKLSNSLSDSPDTFNNQIAQASSIEEISLKKFKFTDVDNLSNKAVLNEDLVLRQSTESTFQEPTRQVASLPSPSTVQAKAVSYQRDNKTINTNQEDLSLLYLSESSNFFKPLYINDVLVDQKVVLEREVKDYEELSSFLYGDVLNAEFLQTINDNVELNPGEWIIYPKTPGASVSWNH